MTKVLYLLCIHPVINKRVDHCIRHCQPIERQVHVLNIAWLGDRIVVVHQDEEPMIWEPTDAEDSYDNHEHFYDLRTEMCFSNAFFMGIMGRWKTRSQKNKKKERKKIPIPIWHPSNSWYWILIKEPVAFDSLTVLQCKVPAGFSMKIVHLYY